MYLGKSYTTVTIFTEIYSKALPMRLFMVQYKYKVYLNWVTHS